MVRHARHNKWLARATRDQLIIGLKRVDLLEEAWDRVMGLGVHR